MTKEEFEQLTQVFRPRLVKSAINRWGDEGEDAIQEAFLRAYESRDTFKHEMSFSTWIFAIAKNIIVNWKRKDKLEYAEMDIFTLPEESDMEEVVAVRQWMDTLTPGEKRAIMDSDGNANRQAKFRAKRKWEGDL